MRIALPITLVALAGLALVGREALPDSWSAPPLAHAAAAVLLAAAAAVLFRRRAPTTLGVAFLVLAAAALLPLALRSRDAGDWRGQEAARLTQRFTTVQAAWRGLESQAQALGTQAKDLLPDSTVAVTGPERRAALFESLARLTTSHAAPRRTIGDPGIQLFDPHGDLLAWAGTPRAIPTSMRLTRFAGGARHVYLRQSGVHTLFSYEIHDSSATAIGPGTPRVLVDLPVEVRYRISNRFLQSRSLGEDLTGDGIEVSFVYDAPEVPAYLVGRELEIQGDEARGLQGLGIVRDASGAPLLLCRLNGLPYGERVEARRAHAEVGMRWLVIAAVVAGWAALGMTLRRRGAASGWALVVPIAAVWSVRLLLALLDLPSTRGGGALANPAAFAMVGFAGILRSPLDLALTAIAVASTAAILFVYQARRALGSGSASGQASTARVLGGLVVAAAVIAVSVAAAFVFVQRIAANSNPHLVGSELDLLAPAVACLELAILVGVVGWLVLAVLVAHRLQHAGGWVLVAGVALLLCAALAATTSWVTALAGTGVFLAALRLRSLFRDPRFTSFGLGCFVLVALATTLITDALYRESFRTDRTRAEEAAAGILGPGDELRRFTLDDVLQKVQDDIELEQALRTGRGTERSALAFEVWAQSMLSHLGYACEVRVYDTMGELVSEFAIDMPPGREEPVRELLEKVRATHTIVTEDPAETSRRDAWRAYRGAVTVRSEEPVEDLGVVVVTLPYAQASLDVAADPRTRTPEVLRNLQEEGIGPRVDDAEQLLLAWLERGFVVESSTAYLEVGQALRFPPEGGWQKLRLVNGDYWVTRVVPEGSSDRALLAGFRLASPLDRLLEWAQIGSFGFAVTLLALLALLVVARLFDLGRRLPPLFVPKRLGFQQKLMVAFLVVSLLPSAVLSLATRDIMRDRSVRRNRDAALVKARAAGAALADLVRRDLDAVRESEYLRSVLAESEAPPVRDIGHLEFSQIMVFRGDGRLVLDETLSNLSDADARAFVEHAPRTAFASRDGRHLCLGALEKVWFSRTDGMSDTAPDAEPYWVFYRRRLTDRLLRNLAPILSTDISGFLGPELAVSSQKSLATAGLLPSLVPPDAYAHAFLRRNRWAVVEERTGKQRYFAGYLPLEDARGDRIGAIAVSQLLQPDEFSIEVERTRDLVLGLSTLMFVLTLVLGVFFATRIFDPVRSLIEGTRRIAGGDLGFRLRAGAGDEIGELERSFNEMTTRLQEARRALDQRRRYLEAVLGNIASGVIATDADARITAANPAAFRLLRLEPGALEGRTWGDLASRSDSSAMASFWRRLSEAPDGEVVEIPVLETGPAAGGPAPVALDPLTLRVIVTDLHPATGGASQEPLGRVAIFEDVTELIRSKKLSAWAEMARQVAHEIKNPLTPMKLSAQFMEQAFRDRSDKFPRIFEEGMATIIQQVDSLRRIATEFSNFGRVQKLQPRPLDLAAFLQSVTAPYTQIAGLELEVANGDADGLRVLGDDEGLRRVFRNLLENARESMDGRGKIVMRVERSDADHVQVRIADEGPGISPETAARLFEPYFSTKSTGTGLGLAISRGILEELGGGLQIANRPQGGAEACVTLVLC